MVICRELFDRSNVDAVLVLSSSNTFYLSGFESSNCQIVITKDNQYFITDKRYYNEAVDVLKDRFEVIAGGYEDIQKILTGIKKLGWDSNVSYETYKLVSKLFAGIELVEITKIIETLRMFKTKQEIENIKIALNEILKLS